MWGETESISQITTTYEVGENYRGILADLTCGILEKRTSWSDQQTHDDLLAVYRHHRQQLECPPILDNSREGSGLPHVGLGLMPG
jgi:hypothetical protein